MYDRRLVQVRHDMIRSATPVRLLADWPAIWTLAFCVLAVFGAILPSMAISVAPYLLAVCVLSAVMWVFGIGDLEQRGVLEYVPLPGFLVIVALEAPLLTVVEVIAVDGVGGFHAFAVLGLGVIGAVVLFVGALRRIRSRMRSKDLARRPDIGGVHDDTARTKPVVIGVWQRRIKRALSLSVVLGLLALTPSLLMFAATYLVPSALTGTYEVWVLLLAVPGLIYSGLLVAILWLSRTTIRWGFEDTAVAPVAAPALFLVLVSGLMWVRDGVSGEGGIVEAYVGFFTWFRSPVEEPSWWFDLGPGVSLAVWFALVASLTLTFFLLVAARIGASRRRLSTLFKD